MNRALAVVLPAAECVVRLAWTLALVGGLAWDVAVRKRTVTMLNEYKPCEEYVPRGGWS